MSDPDPDSEHKPKPLLGWTFWAMLALGTVCVLAGAAVAFLLPKLLSPPS